MTSLCVSEHGENDALFPQGKNAKGRTENPDYPGLRIHRIDYLGAFDSSFPLYFLSGKRKRNRNGEEGTRDENETQIINFASQLLPESKI